MIEVLHLARCRSLFLSETVLLFFCALLCSQSLFAWQTLTFVLLCLLLLQYQGLYPRDACAQYQPHRILASTFGAGVVVSLLSWKMFWGALSASFFLLITRALYDKALQKRADAQRVLLLAPSAEDFGYLLGRNDILVEGMVSTQAIGNRHCPRFDTLEEALSVLDPNCIVYSTQDVSLSTLREAQERGYRVQERRAFFATLQGKISLQDAQTAQWLLYLQAQPSWVSHAITQALEAMLATLFLLLLSPLLLLVAIAIRLDSVGPVFYRQERLGKFGRRFMLVKFRSMRVDAERDGARWAAASGDLRVTRVGRFLRQSRLDELPQLINIVRGEMSFVGPRPERPMFHETICETMPLFEARLWMSPGLTGYAQVRHAYASSIEESVEKLSFDLYYLQKKSFLFDLAILLETVKVVLLRIGAR